MGKIMVKDPAHYYSIRLLVLLVATAIFLLEASLPVVDYTTHNVSGDRIIVAAFVGWVLWLAYAVVTLLMFLTKEGQRFLGVYAFMATIASSLWAGVIILNAPVYVVLSTTVGLPIGYLLMGIYYARKLSY